METKKQIIKEVNITTLNDALKTIGWKIDGVDEINQFIYDHRGVRTKFRVNGDHIEVIDTSDHSVNTTIKFNFDGCQITIWEDAVSIGTKECFLQCYNFEK